MFEVAMVRDGLTAKQKFWFDHIESCASSGMLARAYADQHGFDVQKLYYWKNKLKTLGVLSESSSGGSTHNCAARVDTCSPDQRSASFIRAAIMPASAPPELPEARSCAVRIALANGITIDVPAGTTADALGALIHTAQQIATGKGGSKP